ncbi:hypothetical protein C5B96_03435 [Subtercola sp. Z020]|uniref:hypothetical protein n=1 Tax=Subtercola sp. Z020 TaxID=2080582 RepID=UPI000CE843F5|nr:hypothetical protein [Subtercola sp. Z020]PPF87850.1 hypothetical protein C5B96_03435 [Subtercola sp. Z020]
MPKGQRRRARRGNKVTPRRRPLRFPIDPEFVARAVDEGVLMARTALTMAAMNHIVVGALGSGREYEPGEVAGFVEGELRALTLEQTAMAAHMRRLMVEFPPSFRKSTTISDHHLLVQRRVIYSALASELERLRADPAFVDAAVEASRRWAWSELGRAIEARLDGALVAASGARSDPEYEANRESRMRTLVEVDLAGLAARTGEPEPRVKGLPTERDPAQA